MMPDVWLFFALLSGLLFTTDALIARHVLRDSSDPWAYSFFFSAVGAAISFPYMLASPQLPGDALPWMLGVLAGLSFVISNLLYFKAASQLEASLCGSAGKVKLVWIFVLGVLFLSVPFSWTKLLGVLLTTAAGVFIVRHFRRRPGTFFAVGLVFIAMLFVAIGVCIVKSLLSSFNPGSVTFFVSFLPAVAINFVLMPNARQRISQLFRTQGKMVLLACSVGAFANIALNEALARGEASAVFVFIESCLILTWAGEQLFLKEKEGRLAKLVAVVLAIAGAVLIQVSS